MPVGGCVMRTAESVVLTPWPPCRRTGDVDAQIGLVDLHLLDLVGLRVDQHAGGRGVHAPLGFGDGHALHAVHAFPLSRPHAVGESPLEAMGWWLLGSRRDRRTFRREPSPTIRDVRRTGCTSGPGRRNEQRRLLTALAGLDLGTMSSSASCGSRGASMSVRLVVEFGDLASNSGTSLGERGIVGSQFAGRLEVAARLQLAVGRGDRRPPGRSAWPPVGRWRCQRAGSGRTVAARGRRVQPARVSIAGRVRSASSSVLVGLTSGSPRTGTDAGLLALASDGRRSKLAVAGLGGLGGTLAVALLEAGHAPPLSRIFCLPVCRTVALRAHLDHDVAASPLVLRVVKLLPQPQTTVVST